MGGGYPLPYPPPVYFQFALRHAPENYMHSLVTASTAGPYKMIK